MAIIRHQIFSLLEKVSHRSQEEWRQMLSQLNPVPS